MAFNPCFQATGGGRSARRVAVIVAALGAVLLLAANDADDSNDKRPQATAGEAPTRGYLIRVPLPITGTVDTQVQHTVEKLLEKVSQAPGDEGKVDRVRPVFILEFSAKSGQAGEGSQFERSLALARFLSSGKLSGIRTVAYLPTSVRGHAVLATIACEEIIMHRDAELGQAGIDEVDPIGQTMRLGYTEIAERSGVIPAPFVLGMLDKDQEILRVKTLDGVRYVDSAELKKIEAQAVVESVDTVTEPGEMGMFTGYDLRESYRFVSHTAENNKALASALRLPPGGIEENPSLGDHWEGAIIKIGSGIDAKWLDWVQRGIEDKLRREEINFLCVEIDSGGGFPQYSVQLANFLAGLDPGVIRTVAYVPHEARADAALIAMACDHVVMGERAMLGGEAAESEEELNPEELRPPIRDLAEQKNRDWSLIAALIEPELAVYRYTLPNGAVRYFCADELAEQEGDRQWNRGEKIRTQAGIVGSLGHELGLARYLAADFDEMTSLYHLKGELAAIEPGWAHSAVEAFAAKLASPWLAHTLLFIAVMALFSEASSPGLGVPGFVSAVCFLLFFWSQFLNGTAGWLEVLLFATGLICLGIEIFVVPGFGVFGIGGGLMVVTSIVLASQTFVFPYSAKDYAQLPYSLSMILAATAGVVGALVVVRQFLPRTKYGKQMMLAPPEGDELQERHQRESVVDWAHLAGKRGVATTRLSPSGKVRIGDDTIAVVSDGEMIDAGTEVYVEEVRGNHVVVRRIDDPR